LRAELFAEIRCSSFQDFAVTADRGQMRYPINELYFYRGEASKRDLIILYGNTQALTTVGQYELCGSILDVSEKLGCRFLISLGGLKREREVETPLLYFAATDKETANELLTGGAKVIKGQIFGVAGLLIGIGRLRGFRGFCLLAETLGLYPDGTATTEVLKFIAEVLDLKLSVDTLGETVKATQELLQDFGLVEQAVGKRRKEESQFRWFV
jgi:uncharacterized protein (TIGR00162 family)